MKIRGSWCAVAMAVLVSTSAFAQETGSSSTTTTSGDSMRQPGGLFDATPHTRKTQVSLWGLAGWYGLGVGGRFTLPLVADGILAEINDSIELEFGADFIPLGFLYAYPRLDIVAEGRWTFHLMPNISLYGKVVVGPALEFWSGGVYLYPVFDIVPGLIYRLSDSMVLRAELGYRGFKGGIGFEF